MDTARLHWKILQGLGTDLTNRVHSFMVIGDEGEGVIVATEDGQGFWLGKMEFGSNETKTGNKPTPLKVPELVQMAHGLNHIMLLNKRGEIYSMGRNNYGQLGLGTVDKVTYFSPQLISIPTKFISVRCGEEHSVALTEDGKVWAWGWNGCRQVGVNISAFSQMFFPSPRQILELDPHRIVAVECGSCHSLALTDRGEVYGWGWNDDGQLGDGTEKPPIRIPTPSPVRSMAAGYGHTLLLTQTGEVWACGDNEFGQLGLPTTTELSDSLVKVAGLPIGITQIASHPLASLSIAMSSDQRCFVWGQLEDNRQLENSITILDTPQQLDQIYTTVDSPLSFYSPHPNTPHSISFLVTPPNRLSARMSRMFDNPETSPDVQFVVEQRTIHAHRIILNNSSYYFARMFPEIWLAPVDREDPIVRVTITNHSYSVFHAFLCFLYTDCFELHSDFLPDLYELATLYLVLDLQKLCISRMRTTLTPITCCLYYQFTYRHPELATFQQELVQFAFTNITDIAFTRTFNSMVPEIGKNFVDAVTNFLN